MIRIKFEDFTYKGVKIDSLEVTSEATQPHEFNLTAVEEYLDWYVTIITKAPI